MATSGLLRRFSAPLANAWRSLLHRFSSRNNRGARSFAKLYNDVQSCPYEDVQVMWSIIHHHQVQALDLAPSGEAAAAAAKCGVKARAKHM
eukprot:c7991_g1_i1 orf=255-527(-)